MVRLNNKGPIEFKRYVENKRIFVFGAGRALESCLDIYFGNKDIECIIDNSENLWGNTVKHKGKDVEIISKASFVKIIEGIKKNHGLSEIILMITSPFYAAEIVEDLDKIDEFDGLECYLQILIRNTKEKVEPFKFTEGSAIIPKKIHYIWVGGNPLPDEYKRNIDSWRKYNPDYEIIRWDESNYDFTKCNYVREAYETKSWGFVPNFARLDIIYEHGGIYLDTDVEVIRNFDCLLNDKAFFNMGCSDRVNQGCGFGAVPKCDIIYDMRQAFIEECFLNEIGKPRKRPCHNFVHPVMKKYGFDVINLYQKIDDIVLYPTEVMSPLTLEGMENYLSDKTVSMHKEEGSWKKSKEQNGYRMIINLVKRVK